MEELLATIPSAQIRDYMREAMNSYMAGAYRGSIVLSYIALFDDVLAKLGELASVNTDAKTIFQEASKRKANQDVYESYLIDHLGSKNLLSGLDTAFLNTLRTLRNKSAHPSGHKPSPEEARFIFYETVARFLSRPILSTTQLVEEIVSRLSNANFFPAAITTEMQIVVCEEVAALHTEAIPQLISKLVASVTSSDPNIAKNAAYFLIGLALLNGNEANKAIQSKLLTAKSDDPLYASVVLQVLSANGGLIAGLSSTCICRIRATLSNQIDEVTAMINESKLNHPTYTLNSIAKHLSETELIANFKPELEKLFNKRPYSALLLDLLSTRPATFELYFLVILSKAGSADFSTANSFANSIDGLDPTLAALLTEEQAFQLVVAVICAADWGAFSAKGLVQSKFAGTPALRTKAIAYVAANETDAGLYITNKLSTTKPIAEFVSGYLTNEEN